MRPVPRQLATADPRVVRPRDLRGVYANPTKELRDLERQGIVARLAHGYYALVPEGRRGIGAWAPSVESAGLAIAQTDYGRDGAALMGMSAARILGVVPRALGRAVVAAVKQRPAMQTTAGDVTFVKRDVASLDLRRVETELATGWTTTVEQTLVDVVDRPALGDLALADASEVIAALAGRADRDLVRQIATGLRKGTALDVLDALWRGADWRTELARRC